MSIQQFRKRDFNELKEATLDGEPWQPWGTKAEQDPSSGSFFWPLTLTEVKPGSLAAAAGLRPGDEIVKWRGDAPTTYNIISHVEIEQCSSGGYLKCRSFVDGKTQKWLETGGTCQVLFRPVPRCIQPRCPGNIIVKQDALDHARICDECGVVQQSSLISTSAEWRSFEGEDDSANRVGKASAPTMLSETGMGMNAAAAAATSLRRAARPGAGMENREARWEGRAHEQRVRASQDISRYCQALHLPQHTQTQALQLFDDTVAADCKGKQQRLKAGAFIDQYSAVILASIHLASRITANPKPVGWILSVADGGAGTTEKAVFRAVERVKNACQRTIPPMEPGPLITFMWGSLSLPPSRQQLAHDAVKAIQTRTQNAAVVAAVAIVHAAGLDTCGRVSETSGVDDKTIHTHLGALGGSQAPARKRARCVSATCDRVRASWQ